MVKALRFGVITVTAVHVMQGLFVVPAANNFNDGYADAFTTQAGYFFGWKINDVFDFSDSWGKLSYVLSLVVTYGLFVCSILAIAGLAQAGQNRPAQPVWPPAWPPAGPVPPVSPTPPAMTANPPGAGASYATANVPPGQQPADGKYEALERLHKLHASGALTAEEFEAEKRRLLM
jgi:hypothetical protein